MNAGAAGEQKITAEVRRWLNDCVLGLSLCPYARVPYQSGRVRLVVIAGEKALAESLKHEVQHLQSDENTETTLLILASGLASFLDFNDRVGDFEDSFEESGVLDFQLVGFHPRYLFAGEAEDDPSHCTNRAPYPIVQILRAESVEKAAQEGDTSVIPERNIETLRSLSPSQLRSLFPWG